MKLYEMIETLGLEVVTKGEDKDVTGCYIGDMLSVVMSRAEEGNIWLTVQTNVNIDAVAVLTECAGIVLVEGMEPDEETKEKAKMQDVTILKTQETAYSLACRIKEIL